MAFPFIYTIILLFLYFILVRAGFDKLSEQRNVIRAAEKTENILKEKEALLKNLQPTLPSYVTTTTLAFPEKNPALIVISQLKRFAGENAIFLEDLRIGGERPSAGKSILSVSFTLTGTFEQVLSFLKQVKTSAPLVYLNGLELSKLGDEGVSMDVKASFSWAAYPEKISSLEEPLVKLSQEELDTLSLLAKLEKSVFGSLSPQSPSGRINPFVQ